jgi:hypothetical protein
MMDRRERLLIGAHGFDWKLWIFEGSFSFSALRDITNPKWLARILCKLGKHAWWLDSAWGITPLIYRCEKCGIREAK